MPSPSSGNADEAAPAQPEHCKYRDCMAPLAFEQIVLLSPDGSNRKLCGPYCEGHRDWLRGNLIPTYTGGGPAFKLVARSLPNFLGLPDA